MPKPQTRHTALPSTSDAKATLRGGGSTPALECAEVTLESHELVYKASAWPHRSGYYFIVRIKQQTRPNNSRLSTIPNEGKRNALTLLPDIAAVPAPKHGALFVQKEYRQRYSTKTSFWGNKVKEENIIDFRHFGNGIPSGISFTLHPKGWTPPAIIAEPWRLSNQLVLTTHPVGTEGFFSGQEYIQIMKGTPVGMQRDATKYTSGVRQHASVRVQPVLRPSKSEAELPLLRHWNSSSSIASSRSHTSRTMTKYGALHDLVAFSKRP